RPCRAVSAVGLRALHHRPHAGRRRRHHDHGAGARLAVADTVEVLPREGALETLSGRVGGEVFERYRTNPARRGRNSVISGKRIRMNSPTTSEARYGQ